MIQEQESLNITWQQFNHIYINWLDQKLKRAYWMQLNFGRNSELCLPKCYSKKGNVFDLSWTSKQLKNLTFATGHGMPEASAFIQLQHVVASLGNLTFKINSKNITFSLIDSVQQYDIHSCDRPYFTGDLKSNTWYWRFKWSQHTYKRSNFASIHAVVSYTSSPSFTTTTPPAPGIC